MLYKADVPVRARYAAVIVTWYLLQWTGVHHVEGMNSLGHLMQSNTPLGSHAREYESTSPGPNVPTVGQELGREEPQNNMVVLPHGGNLSPTWAAPRRILQTETARSKRRRLQVPTRKQKVAAVFSGSSETFPSDSLGAPVDDPQEETSLASLLAEYANRHRSATTRPGYSGKYVQVVDAPTNGLGNRLPGFVAGLFLALATDRVLLCDWPRFEPYFDNAEGLDFSWTRQVERYKAWALPELWPQLTLDATNYTLWLQVDWTSHPVFTRDVVQFNYLADDLVPVMAANSHIRPFVEQYFSGGSVFQPLATFLLRFSPDLRGRVETFQSENFGAYTVGLQIRRDKGLRHTLPDIRTYVDAALASLNSQGIPAKDIVIFVATDTPEVQQQVAAMHPSSMVVWTEKDMQKDEESGNPGKLDDALIDVALLSMCTEIVTSYGSSFGGLAAGMGGLLPIFILPGPELAWQGWGAARRSFFFRGITSEPCFHHATELLLSNDTDLVAAWKDGCPHWMQHAQCHW